MASLIAGSTLLATAASTPARAALDNFGYGISDQQQIVEVNLTQQTFRNVFDAAEIICGGIADPIEKGLCKGDDGGRQKYFSNSFAYDDSRRQFFFLDYEGNLRYWDFTPTSTLPTVAGKTANGLDLVNPVQTQFTANATYHDSAYWYFIDSAARNQPPGTNPSPDRNKLVKFAFTYGLDGKPNGGTVSKYTVDGLPSDGTLDGMRFGDIAIDGAGKLYANTTNGKFFTLDTNTCSGTECTSGATILPVTNPSLQLAFNSDFTKLYGHTKEPQTVDGKNYLEGGWGTVDPSTGVYTPIDGASPFVTTPLRDIAGSSTRQVDVPGPLPLLGAGAAFGWTRRLRRRLRGAQADRSSR